MSLQVKLFERPTMKRLETALNKFLTDSDVVMVDHHVWVDRSVDKFECPTETYRAAIWYESVSDVLKESNCGKSNT